jgi:hypothetical protein
MEQHEFSIIRLDKWQEFKLLVEEFSENWAYRGQADASWVLNNAIERTGFINFHERIEADFVAEFQRGARNYLTKDETPGHLIEWLALMQHHGAPTRLLDLTKSPYIAAFFAYEICAPDAGTHAAVWAVNVNYLREKALGVLSQEFGEALQQSNNLINEVLFEKIFYANNRKLVFPVEPFSMNRRYSLQQSIFISTGISHVPLMEQFSFLGSEMKRAVVKIELPASHKKDALRELQQMNLHRASLFPDLDGYAASLKLRYESMRSPDEVRDETTKKEADQEYKFIP